MEACVLDTSIIIEIFDKGNEKLLEHILQKYKKVYIPWLVLYEYLYGHKYLGRDVVQRKQGLEKLGVIKWLTQDIILKTLEIDIELRKKGLSIPFSDIVIAATAIMLQAEIITLDKKHYERIPELMLYIPDKKLITS